LKNIYFCWCFCAWARDLDHEDTVWCIYCTIYTLYSTTRAKWTCSPYNQRLSTDVRHGWNLKEKKKQWTCGNTALHRCTIRISRYSISYG